MKVHPAIFMKTKERGKMGIPNFRKDAWGAEGRSLRRAGGMIRTSSFCLLTPEFCSQNEGASGDLYENKH
jgi:hypothetical protein